MRRAARLALRVYPRSFRSRYGDELATLVEDLGQRRGLAFDLWLGVARAWLRPRTVANLLCLAVAAAVFASIAPEGAGRSDTATTPDTPASVAAAIYSATSCTELATLVTAESKPMMVGCSPTALRAARIGHSFHIDHTWIFSRDDAVIQLNDVVGGATSVAALPLVRERGAWRMDLRGTLFSNPMAAFAEKMSAWIVPVCRSHPIRDGIETSCHYPA